MSLLVGVNFTTGVELPLPQVPSPTLTCTVPPSQPQSTVALALTVSHSCPSKSPPLVVSLTCQIIDFPSSTNFDKVLFVDPAETEISNADSKESVADSQELPPSSEYLTL